MRCEFGQWVRMRKRTHIAAAQRAFCSERAEMQVVPVLSAIFLASTVSVTVALVETTAFSPTNGVVNLEVTLAVEVCMYGCSVPA